MSLPGREEGQRRLPDLARARMHRHVWDHIDGVARGKLLERPLIFTPELLQLPELTDDYAETTAPSEYPMGLSILILDSATGWPWDNGYVETLRTGSAKRQWVYPRVTDAMYEIPYTRSASTTDTWEEWRLAKSYEVRLVANGSTYNPTQANTWETTDTGTLSDLHDDFTATVLGEGQVWCQNPATAETFRARIGVSTDGGSTWSDQTVAARGGQVGNLETTLHPRWEVTNQAVTGTIQVRLQVQATDTGVDFTNRIVRVLVF